MNKVKRLLPEGKQGMVSVDELSVHPDIDEIYDEPNVEALAMDIEENGFDQANPITVTPEGRIVKGNRRFEAAVEVGMGEVPVVVKRYNSSNEEIFRSVMDNAVQRDRTGVEKYRESKLIKPILEEEAKERMLSAANGKTVSESEKGRTRAKLADAVGLGSGDTYRRIEEVVESAEGGFEKAQEQVDLLERGEQSIHGAYREVEEEKEEEAQEYIREHPDDSPNEISHATEVSKSKARELKKRIEIVDSNSEDEDIQVSDVEDEEDYEEITSDVEDDGVEIEIERGSDEASIPCSPDTKDKYNTYKRWDETWDTLLTRVIDDYEG